MIKADKTYDNGINVDLTVTDETGVLNLVRSVQNVDSQVLINGDLKVKNTATFAGGKSSTAVTAYDQYISDTTKTPKTTVNGMVDLLSDLTTTGKAEWANALRIHGGGFAATGDGTADYVKLEAKSANYSAQALAFGKDADLTFENYAQIDIISNGTGANAVAGLGSTDNGTVTFSNIGSLNMKSTAAEGVSNAVGVMLGSGYGFNVSDTGIVSVDVTGSGGTTGSDGTASTATNSVMSNVLDLVSGSSLSLNRVAMNDVRKRLGDLCSAEGLQGV